MSAGYSGTPLPQKLGVMGDVVFTVLHAPPGFAATLGDHGESIWQRNLMAPIDVVIAFFTERAALRAEWPTLTEAAQPDGAVWVMWPKKASGVATDITEDALRNELLKTRWVDNKVCAVDDTWSGLRFVLRKDNRPHRKR
ncbi:MAG: DUF3052 domain-containing protein [Actinomycetota bacterium]|nr:DUF3052 domain-containing protein [Actinomycetota bacterium]